MKTSANIQEERVHALNGRDVRPGAYVLYWMQQSQRSDGNHALEYAVQEANRLAKPLVIVFGLTSDYPQANLRHYQFMLEGLGEAQQAMERRGMRMVVERGRPHDVAGRWGREAAMIVCDRGYLRHQVEWRQSLAEAAGCRVVEIEADAVVPVETASDHAELAARTLRPKIRRHLDRFLVPLRQTHVERDSLHLPRAGLDLSDPAAAAAELGVDASVPPVTRMFRGGQSEAGRLLRHFIRHHLAGYAANRGQPHAGSVSHLGKYFHFGQISPVAVAVAVARAPVPQVDRDAFIEELIVRRELAINFVWFTDAYDSYSSLPPWARKTLAQHANDPRPYLYGESELEAACTHDPYWNAAMREMRYTGYMHNHMRMYWGKKILEWSATPEEAFLTALTLNNRYFLDGRDANSFAGVGWIFGLHDRPWPGRPVFGAVRSMTAQGLRRKCDIEGYVAKVDDLIKQMAGN